MSVDRYIGLLKSVHLRHDNPRLFPGWELDQVEVFVAAAGKQDARPTPAAANPSAAAAAVSAAAATPSVPAPAGAEAGAGVDAGGMPRVYCCRVDPSAPLDAWPAAEAPYIRHYATLEAEKFSETSAR